MGIIIRKALIGLVEGFFPISERILIVKVNTPPFMTNIIQCYAPTADSKDEEIELFYNQMNEAIAYCKSQEVIIVMGDMNAKIGKGKVGNVVGDHGLGKRNKRGEKLIEWCAANGQVVTNTWFKRHKKDLWTWKSPNGKVRNQIEFFTINHRFRNNVVDTRCTNADCGSDHRMLVSKISSKLKLKK